MKIQQIQLNSYNHTGISNNNITCGYKSPYLYLKSVPGNCCACCGNEMIPAKDISAAWSKITRPLTTLLKEGRFDFAETVFPQIYKILTKFAKKYPDKSLDSIVSEPNNHYEFMTAIADSFEGDEEYKKLSAPKQQREVSNRTMEMFRISSAVLKDSAEVIKNLKPLEHYLHGYRKKIFQELEGLSEKYPDKKLYEIIKYPEVAEKYVENTYLEATEFAKIRDEHWNKADKIISDKYPELEIPLKKLYTSICQIYRGIIDPVRVAYEIREKYNSFIDSYKLDDIREPVMAEITQMPTILFSENSFLSFARRYYNDSEIVNYVIKPFMESATHIDTISEGGTNAISNIIMMCRDCNESQKNFTCSKNLAIHPEMIENSKKQIDFYADKILAGELPEILKNYPIKIAKKLYRSSEGLIDYNTDNYLKELEKKEKLSNNHQ